MAPLVAHRSQGKAHPLPISPIRVTVYIVLEALLSRLVLALPAPLVRSRGSQSYGSSPPGVDRAKMPVIRQQSCWHEERRESEKRETGSEANTPPGLAQKVWLT